MCLFEELRSKNLFKMYQIKDPSYGFINWPFQFCSNFRFPFWWSQTFQNFIALIFHIFAFFRAEWYFIALCSHSVPILKCSTRRKLIGHCVLINIRDDGFSSLQNHFQLVAKKLFLRWRGKLSIFYCIWCHFVHHTGPYIFCVGWINNNCSTRKG